ncbi:MAG: heparinase II/III family protein [Clostridia bacterium]|nr:heparinase II/III family protein [Clostridia bacterium]
MICPTLKDQNFWKNAARDPRYAAALSKVEMFWEQRYEEIPVLTYEDRMLYYKTGDRKRFETPYFRRRNTVSAAAILALMHPEETVYVDYVQRMLWAICDEYSWAVPAHTDGTLEEDTAHIDLFSAETALALTEICYALEERLEAPVCHRVRSEVKRRVIDTYCTKISWFEGQHNNWASVCSGNVGAAMMYLAPDAFEAQLPRLLDSMARFIDDFSDDGVCMEGATYWTYGFSSFAWFAEMLLSYTNGKIDLWRGKKVEKIAGYMLKSFLKGNTTVSFADGGRYGKAFEALQYLLSQKFPRSVHMLPPKVSAVWTGNVTWLHLTRSFFYAPPVDVRRALPIQSYDFPSAGQVIVNEDKYSLFVKAGHNNEPHNHNDVGSFILSTEHGQVFCDIGSGLYTRQYFRFSMHERYAILCNSSRGHSVPVINGCEQMMGCEFKGSIAHNGNRINVEMAGAYDIPALKRLSRSLEHGEREVILTDSYEGELASFVERFVTLLEPTVCENAVRVANVVLHFDPQEVMLNAHTDTHLNHAGEPVTVHVLDFALAKETKKASFTFEIL